jgi:putative transposase
VARSGYYAYRQRGISQRRRDDMRITERIRGLFDKSRGTYGSPRIHALLRREGMNVGRKRVARLMAELQLRARVATIYRRMPGTKAFFATVPNRLPRRTTKADRVWVADITWLRLPGRWHYLVAVMDKHSRRILSWSLASHRTAKLTLRALNRAVLSRQPKPGLVFHTDRGVEFGAYGFRDRLRDLDIVQSMNRPCQMNDNARMESFFHSLKSEELHGRHFQTEKQLASAIRSYVGRYNRTRLHSALGYRSPIDYERLAA